MGTRGGRCFWQVLVGADQGQGGNIKAAAASAKVCSLLLLTLTQAGAGTLSLCSSLPGTSEWCQQHRAALLTRPPTQTWLLDSLSPQSYTLPPSFLTITFS